MVFIKEKRVKNKKYFYLIKRLRLPDGKTVSIEKILKNKNKSSEELFKENIDFFIEKEKNIFSKFALDNFKSDSIFSKEELKKIEEMRVEYRHIIKSFNKLQKKDAFDRFVANFTYESNALEGNSLTLKDVAIIIFEKRSVEGKELREIYETKNSREVMDLILKKKFDVKEKDIIKMHEMLMKDIDERTGYKKFPNYLTGRNVKLTPPEKVKEEMESLIDWYKKNINKLHPLQVSALIHHKFVKIHPFEDGNGRVARFLSNAILVNKNYPPLIIRKSQRTSYINSLADADRGYTGNLERIFLRKYKDTYKKFFQEYFKYTK